MKKSSSLPNVLGWIFGFLLIDIGFINIFWGNDQGFGVFILLLSLLYFPPVSDYISKRINIKITWPVKIIIGIFIIWAALGVGELFDKIKLMMN